MKIVFLDIDGVLRTCRGVKTPCPYVRPTRWLEGYRVERLNDLLREEDAFIVISSTWRVEMSQGDLSSLLETQGVLEGRIIGTTPQLFEDLPVPPLANGHQPYKRAPRGREIRAWLSEFDGDVTGFVVLDDDCDMEGVEDHFVHVDGYLGLTRDDVREAQRILREPCQEQGQVKGLSLTL